MENRRDAAMALDDMRLPLFRLGDGEMKALIARAQAGDAASRDGLIRANLRLVVSLVQRYAERGGERDDLFQVGTIGLIKAIDKFDLSIDVRFSTYAVPVILGEIRQYLRGNAGVKIGRALHDLAMKALRKKAELLASLEREPTVAEVAAALEVDPSDVVDALDAARPVTSLFEPVSNTEDSQYVLDRVKGGEAPEETGLLESIDLKEALRVLSPKERLVIELRYGSGLTQAAIAPRLGVSQVQIFRIERGALQKIRACMG